MSRHRSQYRHVAGGLSRAITPSLTVTSANLEYLHVLRQFDEELFIALQVVNIGGVATREGGHRLNGFPVEIVMNSVSSGRSSRNVWTPIAFSINGLMPTS